MKHEQGRPRQDCKTTQQLLDHTEWLEARIQEQDQLEHQTAVELAESRAKIGKLEKAESNREAFISLVEREYISLDEEKETLAAKLEKLQNERRQDSVISVELLRELHKAIDEKRTQVDQTQRKLAIYRFRAGIDRKRATRELQQAHDACHALCKLVDDCRKEMHEFRQLHYRPLRRTSSPSLPALCPTGYYTTLADELVGFGELGIAQPASMSSSANSHDDRTAQTTESQIAEETVVLERPSSVVNSRTEDLNTDCHGDRQPQRSQRRDDAPESRAPNLSLNTDTISKATRVIDKAEAVNEITNIEKAHLQSFRVPPKPVPSVRIAIPQAQWPLLIPDCNILERQIPPQDERTIPHGHLHAIARGRTTFARAGNTQRRTSPSPSSLTRNVQQSRSHRLRDIQGHLNIQHSPDYSGALQLLPGLEQRQRTSTSGTRGGFIPSNSIGQYLRHRRCDLCARMVEEGHFAGHREAHLSLVRCVTRSRRRQP